MSERRTATAPIAIKSSVDTGRTNVGNRDDLDVVRIDGPDQDVAFVASANDANTDGGTVTTHGVAVIEIGGAQSGPGYGAGGDRILKEVAPGMADRFIVILATNLFFFRCQIHILSLSLLVLGTASSRTASCPKRL